MTGAPPALDAEGRLVVGAELSGAVVGFYVVLLALVLWAGLAGSLAGLPNLTLFLVAVLAAFLARYLSTHYRLDADRLRAVRLFGSRSIALDEVRRIEFANLREIGTVSFFGGWGWRGRVWSPRVGRFDSVSTVSRGLLVSAGPVPVFISPKHLDYFARELSRRVRSHTGVALEVDAGDPRSSGSAAPAY